MASRFNIYSIHSYSISDINNSIADISNSTSITDICNSFSDICKCNSFSDISNSINDICNSSNDVYNSLNWRIRTTTFLHGSNAGSLTTLVIKGGGGDRGGRGE